MKEVQPQFKIPNRKKIAARVWDLYVLDKFKLFEAMHNQRVSITIDTWTSVQNINYIVVTAHFMDSE